jgi:peroxiredoxin
MTIRKGAAAPAFTLPAHDGSAVSLRDFRGQTVVL